MTEEYLINKIITQAKQARKLIEGNDDFNIKRGMAHSISGYCEDAFALYIARKLQNSDLLYFVDKVISTRFEGKKKSTSFKPDLAIVTPEKVLTHYFDLKTNLGWNRFLKDYLQKKNNFIENLISHNKAWITGKKEWDNFNSLSLSISPELKYHIVVIFGGNINERTMKENVEFANNLEYVQLDILKPDDSEMYDPSAFQNIEKSLQNLYSLTN